MSTIATVGRLQVVDDVTPAGWIVARMHANPLDVCAIVPNGYEAYARIFHPAYEYDVSTGQILRRLSWAEIAASTGRTAHSMMQWENISPVETTFQEPMIGTLPVECAKSLEPVLAAYTTTYHSCWFGVWNGKPPLLVPEAAPVFQLPMRDMYLLHGTLSGQQQNLAPPPMLSTANISWPDDRSWILATDIDLRTTYLAASADCVEALTQDHDIEAYAMRPTDLVTLASDILNSRRD